MIGLAGEGGGKGHRNFLPGVLAGDGATPAGSGLWNGLAENEWDGVFLTSPEMGLGGTGECFDSWRVLGGTGSLLLLATETAALLLQQCPIVEFRDSVKVRTSDGGEVMSTT